MESWMMQSSRSRGEETAASKNRCSYKSRSDGGGGSAGGGLDWAKMWKPRKRRCWKTTAAVRNSGRVVL